MGLRILLLDVMDTLVVDPIHDALPAHFGLDKDGYYAVKDKEAWLAFERGEISEEEHARRMFTDGRKVDNDDLRQVLATAYRWVPGMAPLLAELHREGVQMHALSNYPCWYELVDQRMGLSRYLAWSFVSCETGVRKPQPEAYTGAAATLGVDPGACLFVDDREKNVVGAREVGMCAVRFVDASDLRRRLVAASIL